MKNILKINKVTILSLLSILTCMTSTPYITHYLFGGAYLIISTFLTLLVAFTSYKYYKTDYWIKVLVIFWFSYLIYGVLLLVVNSNIAGLRTIIGLTIKLVFIIASAQIIKLNVNKYTNLFIKCNYYIVIGSIILFVILLFYSIDPIIFTKSDGRNHYLYLPFGATNSRLFLNDITFIRIAGLADEPGALALILSYLLVINEISIKSKKYRFILSIGAIFTFSFAFYITSIPLLYYWLKKGIIKKMHMIIFVFTIFTAIPILMEGTPMYKAIDKFVLSRFEVVDGEVGGDNRSSAFPKQIEAFKESPVIGVGNSKENVNKYLLGNPSFVSFLGQYGIYGYMFFYLPFIYLFYTRKKYRILLLVIGINYLQRPCIEEMFALLSLTLIYYGTKSEYTISIQNVKLLNKHTNILN